MITEFSELLDICRHKLIDYLAIHNYQLNNKGLIKCINPNHDDHNPSMKLRHKNNGEGTPYLVCYTCKANYDTLNLASQIHDIPLEGEEFVRLTKLVANELKIPFNIDTLTPEQVKREAYRNVYDTVNHILSSSSLSEKAQDFVDERLWSEDSIEYFKLGSMPYSALKEQFNTIYPDYDLLEFGIVPDLFNENLLSVPFYDHHGYPVGYAARNLNYVKGKDGSKWLYTKITQTPFFQKNEILFNFDKAVKAIRKGKTDTLYVVEGQGDVFTMHEAGLPATVAIGTTWMTEGQARAIKKLSPNSIVFLFDGDDPGKQGAINTLEKWFVALGTSKKFVIELPDSHDPDTYLREFGMEGFNALPRIPAFTYLLNQYKTTIPDPTALAAKVIPLIASFPTALHREQLAKELSFITDFTLRSILEDIDSIVHEKENNRNSKVKDVVEDLTYEIKKNPTSAIRLIDDARVKIQAIDSTNNTDALSGEFYASLLSSFREDFDAKGTEFPGYALPMMPEFAKRFNNDWRGKMLAIGGTENAGKSSFGVFMSTNLVLAEENNCRAIYMTIDDTVQTLFTKQIALLAKWYTRSWSKYLNGFPMNLNYVSRPRYWGAILREFGMEDDMYNALQIGYQEAARLAREERYMIIGIPHVHDLNDFRRSISRLRNIYHNDNLYGHLDNAHKLPVTGGDPRAFYTNVSNQIKNIAGEYNMTTGATVEYNSDMQKRAKDGRPTNDSLAEARAFRYDADAIIHLHNDLHRNPTGSPWFHMHSDPKEQYAYKLPIVEAIIGKNKIDGYKGTETFEFHPYMSYFDHKPLAETIKKVDRNAQALSKKRADEDDGEWDVSDE
jgi:DNA primase catalytic core